MVTTDFSSDFPDEAGESTIAAVDWQSSYWYCSSVMTFSDWNEHDDENVDHDWSAVW